MVKVGRVGLIMADKPIVPLEDVLQDILDIRYAQVTDLKQIVETPVYSEIAATALGTQQTGIGTTFTKITQFNDIIREKNMTVSGANNNVTIDITGLFLVNGNISFTGTDDTTFEISLFVNDTKITHITNVTKIGTGGDVGALSFMGTISLAAADVVDVRVAADSEGNDFRVVRANLIINKVR
jgi:hypothetical protein